MKAKPSATAKVRVRSAVRGDYEPLLRWRSALWPKAREGHENLLREVLDGHSIGELPLQLFVAEAEGMAGFIEVSLRSRADGCDPRRPVAYIEAWYVEPAQQRSGVGAALFQAAEAWAREQGCSEMASDTWIDALDAQHAHEALGFTVVDRCVHYRKLL